MALRLPIYGYPVKQVGNSLTKFQDMLTSFFAAVRDKKPRERAVYDDETVSASTLNFGYSYGGSLGLVFYMPCDQLLATETDMDIAVATVISLTDKHTVGEVRAIADQFGKAAVKSFYSWSKAQTDAALSVDLKWQRGKDTKFERLIQPSDLERVQGIIKIADDRTDAVDTMEGVLVALNVTGAGSFKMSFPEAELRDISGRFDKSFNRAVGHPVPGRYKATVRKITVTSLWSDDERIEWELIELDQSE